MSHHFSLEAKEKDGETEASRIMRREESLKKKRRDGWDNGVDGVDTKRKEDFSSALSLFPFLYTSYSACLLLITAHISIYMNTHLAHTFIQNDL